MTYSRAEERDSAFARARRSDSQREREREEEKTRKIVGRGGKKKMIFQLQKGEAEKAESFVFRSKRDETSTTG